MGLGVRVIIVFVIVNVVEVVLEFNFIVRKVRELVWGDGGLGCGIRGWVF